MRYIIIILIKIYQLLSFFKPRCCRFEPSCSQYMLEAIRAYGTLKGLKLGIKRLLRCHPFNPGGFDPIP